MIVDICCNNQDNGLFDGKASAIRFGVGDDTVFESKSLNGVKITDTGKQIRMHGKLFKYKKMREWFGTWCWNRYLFDDYTAERFLSTVEKSGMWHEGDF